MPIRRRHALVAVLLASLLAACETIALDPELEAPLAGDLRPVVMTVVNGDDQPAVLVVAEDGANGPGPAVGRAIPGKVAAGQTVEVTFGLPRSRTWAIFVNAGPDNGPLITASDVPPDAAGRVPVKIVINADGSPGAEVPGIPGWFGN